VAATGAIIYISHGIYWLDAAVALVIAFVVAYHAERLLVGSSSRCSAKPARLLVPLRRRRQLDGDRI
jgi:Co/Zn/Cd efflux system component